MLVVPCDELMGMHPHEAGSDIKHLVVMRDCMILLDTLGAPNMLHIVKTLIQCQDFPLLPLCGSRPTSDLAVVLSQPVPGVGALTSIDIEFILAGWP